MALLDEMHGCRQHPLIILRPGKIRFHPRQRPVKEAQRQALADFLDQPAVASVRIGIKNRAAEALFHDIAQMLGLT